jgi:hypothetical protein
MAWTASIKLDVANAIFARSPIRFESVLVGGKVVAFKSTGADQLCLEDQSLTKLVEAVVSKLWDHWAYWH